MSQPGIEPGPRMLQAGPLPKSLLAKCYSDCSEPLKYFIIVSEPPYLCEMHMLREQSREINRLKLDLM
jgi:hypothetical protein